MSNEQKVLSLIEKLNALAGKVLTTNQKPADIELDLLKHYLRDTYDAIIQMERSGSGASKVVDNSQPEETILESKEEVKGQPSRPDLEPENSVEKDSGSLAKEEEAEATVPETQNQEKEETKEEEEKKEKDAESTLNDRFKKQEILLSERVADRGDLRKIIDLNKRYLYVNELFEGNEDRYEQAITSLNKMPDYQRAAKFVAENLENQLNWREHQKYRDLFYRSLQKRFGMKSGEDE